ncbi:MAG: anthranilate synthase component I family protein, partial [Caulobacterales bacterium]|nr:anthranilate synthase component I family protein [Caulobacterales bacterium]
EPFSPLKALLGEPRPTNPGGPPFQGGLAGLAAYELSDRIEPLNLARHPDWPDLSVGRYPTLLAFDHEQRRVLAIGTDQAGAATAAGWLDAPERPASRDPLVARADPPTVAAAYEAAVADVIARIHDGEYFQANIARLWTGRLAAGATPFDLLARLAGQSAAPFAGYLRLPGRAVVSNSPERFVSVSAGRDLTVETRPIKGTRPRGATPAEDARLAAELLASDKDRAENLMIVDLMRNDLSRVCTPGAVTTPELFRVESFANVHHLVSTVRGRLAPGLTAIDLLEAAFPPGSVTGAPKVQAMKSIARLEPPRGPYCGALLWAGFDGAFDSSVLIRTVGLMEDGEGWRYEARAGAGIVADSDPRAERLETEDKIAALLRALMEPLT